jgi:hypothetical protein
MTAGPSTERACGDCTLCCKVMAIEEFAKPVGSWCPHCKPGRGCLIYAARPAECRTYSCLWLTDERLDQRWKPSKSKLVLTTSQDGIEIRCDPGFPDAWRKEPYRTQIRKWALSGAARDVTVLVVSGERMILVTPEKEFDLGVMRSDERIVRELDGVQVVGVTVVKALDLENET